MKDKPTDSYWQNVFRSSPANGADYSPPVSDVPLTYWEWPSGTFLDKRIQKIREERRRNLFSTKE